MQRGEFWRASSSVRDRVILLLSADPVIAQGGPTLYGIEAETVQRPPSLLVVPVAVDGQQCWLDVRRGLTRVHRQALTESCGVADPAVLDQVGALVRVALDLG